MEIRKLADDALKHVVAIRRELHRYPEPSGEEAATTDRIARELDKLGIAYHRFDPTGLMADIVGASPGKTIALRADIDALSLPECSGVEYASEHGGLMHACGHDAHTAMLLGAAKLLNGMREHMKGTVRLIFQPAEESASGARAIIGQGAAEGVDAFFAIHVQPQMPAGTVFYKEGPIMAASDTIHITVEGKACHGANPQQGIDATVVSAQIITALQTISSRRISPKDPVVVTIGTLRSGTRFNIVSGRAEMEGTMRYYQNELRPVLQGMLEEIVTGVASANGAKAAVTLTPFTKATINDADMAALCARAAAKIADNVEECEASMGSEDFGEFCERGPGAMFWLGVGGEYPLHSDRFTLDENSLSAGIALYVQAALDYLSQ